VDEWRFRVTPQEGDIAYLPINSEARKIALAWDPDKDTSDGAQCKAYGAVGVMQRPGRLHMAWKDENTLQIDADAGTQTRVLHFGQRNRATIVPMRTIALASLFLFAASAQPAADFTLVAHGGAGDYSKMTPQAIEARRDVMVKAISAGMPYSRAAEPAWTRWKPPFA
jgi:hypothetical protein